MNDKGSIIDLLSKLEVIANSYKKDCTKYGQLDLCDIKVDIDGPFTYFYLFYGLHDMEWFVYYLDEGGNPKANKTLEKCCEEDIIKVALKMNEFKQKFNKALDEEKIRLEKQRIISKEKDDKLKKAFNIVNSFKR